VDNESLAHCPAVRAARVRCGALQGCARRLASIVLYVAGLVHGSKTFAAACFGVNLAPY
jgi:hypothetical protein